MKEVLDDNLMREKDQLIMIDKNRAVFTFERVSAAELAKNVNDIFIEKSYKLEQGSTEGGKYGKGNQVLRILFGAFAKRFCWETKIESNSTHTRFIFTKDAKGYAGGIIGVNQVNNEYKRMTDAFTLFHTTHQLKNN